MSRVRGVVKFFRDGRDDGEVKGTGFGFIQGDDGTEVFVHRSALGQSCFQTVIANGTPRYTLKANQGVTFEIERGERGLKAIKVELVAPAT